ncbi:hypothetical protein LK459_07555 [Gordonia otitidis]|uniref:hypothetical protein n=1 Tax=Gordonia otitidis TaxID=249058 RepID=UPI001D14F8FD|nr:hypothetical protein [Gordonia otitidis]UEA60678.1 hypothetical protein LK459_07555 [Gordonia otitidis]
MRATRYERERASWLARHSKDGSVLRRHSQILDRAARRAELDGAGVAQPAGQDEVERHWIKVHLLGDAFTSNRMFVTVIVAVVAAVTVLPGLVIGAGIYRVLWLASPRITRPRMWPSVAAGMAGAAALLAATLWLFDVPMRFVKLHVDRYFPSNFFELNSISSWGWQLVIGLLFATWLFYSWGWAGVPKKKLVAAKQLPDGTWERIDDKDLVRLDPGVEPDEEAKESEEPQRQLEAPKAQAVPVEPEPVVVPKLPELTPDEIAAQEAVMDESLGFGHAGEPDVLDQMPTDIDDEPEFSHEDERDDEEIR